MTHYFMTAGLYLWKDTKYKVLKHGLQFRWVAPLGLDGNPYD